MIVKKYGHLLYLSPRQLFMGFISLVFVFVQLSGTALASYQDDIKSIYNGTTFYDPSAVTDCSITNTESINSAPPSQVQIANAKKIIGIAKTDGIGKPGALIGLMVGLAESGLKNYANSNVPVSLNNPAKEAVGSDHDSVGVFQQRPSTGWSTIATGEAADSNQAAVWQLMNPAYAAEAFFGSPPRSDAPPALSKGLQNISGWQSLSQGEAAQKVQGSADSTGSNYVRQQAQAQTLLDQNWDSSPAIKLPVPFSGGSSGIASSTQEACATSTTSGNGTYINPLTDPTWQLSRTDQGVDYNPTTKPIPVLAIGDGKILSTDGPGWPGGVFIVYQLSSGPMSGKCIYVAEHLTDFLSVGSTVTAGQTIATALPGRPWTEWGWAQGPQTPSDPYNGRPNGTKTDGGKSFARFLRSLGAQTRDDPGAGPLYYGNTCAPPQT